MEDLNTFSNNIKWRWHFKYEKSSLCTYNVKTKNIQPYSKVVPPEITAWLMGLRMMMYKAHVRAVRLHQKGRQHQNSIQLTWWGLKLLQMSPFYAIPTDKDGGYTLEKEGLSRKIYEEILQRTTYKEVSRYELNIQNLKTKSR